MRRAANGKFVNDGIIEIQAAARDPVRHELADGGPQRFLVGLLLRAPLP